MGGEPDSTVLAEAIRRVVEVAHPLRVILYGSGARGDMVQGSDLDLMVVCRAPIDRPAMAHAILRNMVGLGVPVDILVVSDRILARRRNDPGYIFRTVLAEGKEVYTAPVGNEIQGGLGCKSCVAPEGAENARHPRSPGH